MNSEELKKEAQEIAVECQKIRKRLVKIDFWKTFHKMADVTHQLEREAADRGLIKSSEL